MECIKIKKAYRDKVIGYAAEELRKYLKLITLENYEPIILESQGHNPSDSEGIWLGKFEDFGLDTQFHLEDRELDDAVYINITGANGIIAGSNSRSILLAVYRMLREIGCRWVRPGKDGELLVKKPLSEINAVLSEAASYRHRGVVIEGADSYENVADMIEWLPRAGYNSYFIQFMEAFHFFNNWYKHTNNPEKTPEAFTVETASEYTGKLAGEIKRRGLLYHAVGHGWTCEPLGLSALGWNQEHEPLSSDKYKYLAEVNGKRDFWQGGPINTNLCYSNPEVRELMTDYIVDYIKKHDYIDYLHFWLADDANNHCECESCRQSLPSDLYVMMLNLLDEKLTRNGINTKIVFLLYFDLLWPPVHERINNPGRFTMMFAPITRTFAKSYAGFEGDDFIPDYVRNRIKLPVNLNENLAYLKAWQEVFHGDSFDFDYPLGRAHYGDLGYWNISEVISSDIRSLSSIGLNGFLSCQEQRAFVPTALPNYVMGHNLWNRSLEFKDIAEDYFKSSFGHHWQEAMEYLKGLSGFFDIECWCTSKKWVAEDVIESMSRVSSYVDDFKDVIESDLHLSNNCWKRSWEYLKWHAEYAKLFANVFKEKAKGDEAGIQEAWRAFTSYIQKTEDCIQPGFDVFRIIQLARGKFGISMNK